MAQRLLPQQRGLASMESRIKNLNVKINDNRTQAGYFSRRRRPQETHPTFKRRKVSFPNYME